MKKMFDFLDNLNVIRILQIIAIILLILGIPNILLMLVQVQSGDIQVRNILSLVRIFGMAFTSMLYQPALLLALAQIIRLMKEKNASN